MKIAIFGGSGSLGSALIRRLLADRLAEKIVIFSRDEHRQDRLAEALGHPPEAKWMLGDVRDRDRVDEALARVDTVVHAAAIKHVDLVGSNPEEIFKTNFTGTLHVVNCAVKRNVRRVLVISSDKACGQTAYGLSKAAAEAQTIWANTPGQPQGKYACVRWGNVLGSRGSVVPLWRRQRDRGEPLTLTDEQMTRFWITMDEAVGFTLRALETMRGGEIMVPPTASMRLVDLAEALAPGHPIKVTGMRPGGERLHETLITEDEVGRTVVVPGLGYVIEPALSGWPRSPWAGTPWGGGAYRSDTNPDWWTVNAMRTALKDVCGDAL